MSQTNEERFNPWVSIWTKPRATIARIVQENPNRGLWILVSIYGISGLLNLFQSIMLGRQISLIALYFLAFVIGPFWGYLSVSIWSFVVWFTGKWIKGSGEYKAVRAAYAWSCFPFIVNIALWILMGTFFGPVLFQHVPDALPLTQLQVTFLFLILLGRIAIGVWSIVIYLNALAEVRQLSVLRSIANVVIAAVLIGLFFWLLGLLVNSGGQNSVGSTAFYFPWQNTLRVL